MKVASMTEFPSNISDNIRTVAPQDAITAGVFALRDMDPDAVCPNNRERFARQCDHCIAEAVISAAYPLIAARIDGLIAALLAAPVGMTEYGNDALVALRAEIAAGSAVPVATPERTMPLAQLLAEYRDGDEHGWEAEFEWLQREHASQLDALATSVQETGIQKPIMLGTDGRVWDGHHRLCVASMLGMAVVPVAVATPTEPVDEVKCPDCEATIRARMSDRPGPVRVSVVPGDGQRPLGMLTVEVVPDADGVAEVLVKESMVLAWASNIEHAKGARSGWTPPAEQDGQR